MKNDFHKNPLYSRIYADFEADNEKDNSSIGNKTTNINKQNPILKGSHIETELEGILKNGHHKSHLGSNNVDWLVNEVKKLENKMAFYCKKTKRDIVMTEEDEKDFINNNICRFYEKNFEYDEVRDHYLLTGGYRGPAHCKCNFNVTQDQSIFIPFVFQNFSNYDCDILFEKLVHKKNDKVKFDIFPKTNEEYISVTYGCLRLIDRYRFFFK